MKTLFSLLFVISSSVVFGQNQLGPRIEFVKDSTGWTKFYTIGEEHISQPKDVKFSKKEIVAMDQGKTVVKTDSDVWINSRTSFSLSKYPFFKDTYSVIESSYRISEDKIQQSSSSNYSYAKDNALGFWFFVILLLGSISFVLTVPHRSIISLSLTGIVLLLGITASYFFGLWGFVVAILASGIISGFNAEPCYFNGYEPFWPGLGGGAIRGFICCVLFANKWVDSTDKDIFAITVSVFISVVWTAIVLIRRQNDLKEARLASSQ